MLDLIAIAQSAPGAIAVNGAIVVGYKLAGISGALVAIIATILPPFLILTVLSFLYERFRSCWLVCRQALVRSSRLWCGIWGRMPSGRKYRVDRNHAWCVSDCLLFHVNVVYIILCCIVLGIVRTLLARRRNRR